VSRYQKGKTNLEFIEARAIEWQRHQLGDMQVCTLLQTVNHVVTGSPHHLLVFIVIVLVVVAAVFKELNWFTFVWLQTDNS